MYQRHRRKRLAKLRADGRAGTASTRLHTRFRRRRKVTLSALKGKPVVLYFYPKDDTPGCTKQACAIRDDWGAFEQAARWCWV